MIYQISGENVLVEIKDDMQPFPENLSSAKNVSHQTFPTLLRRGSLWLLLNKRGSSLDGCFCLIDWTSVQKMKFSSFKSPVT